MQPEKFILDYTKPPKMSLFGWKEKTLIGAPTRQMRILEN